MGVPGKTALVLSAGGMFGAYQAGVWKVLSKHVCPDIIVGASVGSLNGWLIASGCGGDELADRWKVLDSIAEVRWRMPGDWSNGMLDGSRLEALIQDMCSEGTPILDFGVVVTEARTMRPRLFRHPDAGWQHIAASCAVPFFLPRHEIGGVSYADGGIVDPLPLWAALEMGATRIVAVNLLKSRSSLVQTLARAIQRYGKYARVDTAGIDLVEIAPSANLGGVWDSMYWTRDKAERWIALGESDCESALGAHRPLPAAANETGTWRT